MDITEIDRRVAAGAELLDGVDPDWFKRVYLDALAINDCERCILGQAFFGYLDGMNQLCPFTDVRSRWQWAVSHGFDTEGDGLEAPEEIVYLEKAWTLEIHERHLIH